VRHAAAKVVIARCIFVKCLTDRHDCSAANLALCRQWIENASGRDRGDDTRDPDRAEFFINPNFNEHRGMCGARELLAEG
jgi:hypothetical protein